MAGDKRLNGAKRQANDRWRPIQLQNAVICPWNVVYYSTFAEAVKVYLAGGFTVELRDADRTIFLTEFTDQFAL